jgi:hypothetical protein
VLSKAAKVRTLGNLYFFHPGKILETPGTFSSLSSTNPDRTPGNFILRNIYTLGCCDCCTDNNFFSSTAKLESTCIYLVSDHLWFRSTITHLAIYRGSDPILDNTIQYNTIQYLFCNFYIL